MIPLFSIRNPQSAIRNCLLSLCACALASSLAGCNVVGAGAIVTDKVLGPSSIDPAYTIGVAPVVVLVENYRNPVGAMSDSETVSRLIVKALDENLNEKGKPPKINVVDPDKLLELQNGRPAEYQKMKINEVGRALGARRVLYVDLITSGVDMTPGSELLRGIFNARVKVIDTATGQTLFPSDTPDGLSITWQTKPQRPSDRVYPAAVRERALRVGADHIARLFYKWKPDDAPDDDAMQAVPEL